VESIETVTITNPANPVLIWWVVAQPLLLLLSYLVGRATRFLLRGRVAVSDAAATLIALIGLWLGLLLAGWLFDEGDLFSVKMLVTSCGVAGGRVRPVQQAAADCSLAGGLPGRCREKVTRILGRMWCL